jgi:hypothetical protein
MNSQTRNSLLEAKGARCSDCGDTVGLHLHHIIPKFRGGNDAPDNLLVLCSSCHHGKHHSGINSPLYSGGSSSHTTIQMEEETRKRLKALGKKGESYDALINRILDKRENKL